MSRSNPSVGPLINPTKRWFQWDSDNKCLKYYDKDAPNEKGGTGKNIYVKLPFQFLVLDVLNTVAGFNDKTSSSFYSNEVRNFMGSTKSEKLVVRLKKEIKFEGTWEQIKDRAEADGAKFANSVYVAFFDENKELQIGNIKLYGAAIGAWINATTEANKKGKKIEECAFKIAETKEGTKGKVTWNEPVFTEITVKDTTNQKAIELDKQLQEYLSEYLKQNHSVQHAPEATAAPAEVIAQQAVLEEPTSAPVVKDDFDDEF